MRKFRIRIEGVPGTALLTHNERLANPSDALAIQMKEITSKRTKTDDDRAELARLEFEGGLYLTDDGKPGIPTWNVFRSFQDGAKLNKLGRAVERSVIMLGVDIVPIVHDGPATPEAMFKAGCYDQRSVKVGMQKVTRTRPVFRNWNVTVESALDTEVLRVEDFRMVIANAGQMAALGDYRPRFGRFDLAGMDEL